MSKNGETLIHGVNGYVTIPNSVTSIGEMAFAGCSGLTSVTIPDSVTNIGDGAFEYCSGLTNVTFMGNAPTIGASAFSYVNSSCVASVSPQSTGWGVAVGAKWNSLTLQYWPEVLTAAANDAEVGEIMETFSDKRLASQVRNTTEYTAFTAWVNGNNLYQPAVIANTNVATAYLLGAERLFENAPTVTVEESAAADSAETMRFKVIPGDGTATKAFLRIRK